MAEHQIFSYAAPAPWSVRLLLLGVFISTGLAGFLRFDTEARNWGRLVVVAALASVGYAVSRSLRRIEAHYRARPWDLPIDQSRLWAHQQERARAGAAASARRQQILGTARLAMIMAPLVYALLILLPGLPRLARRLAVPDFVLWFGVAAVVSLLLAILIIRRSLRKSRQHRSVGYARRTT